MTISKLDSAHNAITAVMQAMPPDKFEMIRINSQGDVTIATGDAAKYIEENLIAQRAGIVSKRIKEELKNSDEMITGIDKIRAVANTPEQADLAVDAMSKMVAEMSKEPFHKTYGKPEEVMDPRDFIRQSAQAFPIDPKEGVVTGVVNPNEPVDPDKVRGQLEGMTKAVQGQKAIIDMDSLNAAVKDLAQSSVATTSDKPVMGARSQQVLDAQRQAQAQSMQPQEQSTGMV